MPTFSGTVTPRQGVVTIDVTPNDIVTFTPASGTYTVEYPIGTVAISASSATGVLTGGVSATQMRILCVSGSVAYSCVDGRDETKTLTADAAAAAQALVSGGGIPGAESNTSANSAGSAAFGAGTATADSITQLMTSTRTAGNAYVMGHDGFWYAAQANEIRRFGSRRVENLLQSSEALESSSWTRTGGIQVAKSAKFGSRGRKSLRRISVTGAGQTIIQTGITVTPGRNVVLQSFCLGQAAIQIVDDGTSAVLSSATYSGQQTLWCAVLGNTAATLRVVISLPPGTVELGEMQLAESLSVTTPQEYVARAVFAGPRFNGDYADGVEYFHSPLSKGCMAEPGQTNAIRQSRNLAAAQWSPSNCSVELVTRPSPYRGLGGVGNQVSRVFFSSGSTASRSIAADWQGTLPADNAYVCGWLAVEFATGWSRLLCKRKDGTFAQVYYDRATGAIGTVVDPGSATPTAWAWKHPDGLLYIFLTYNVGVGATAPSIAPGFAASDGVNNVAGTQEIFVHQAQLTSEINSSPIITTTAALTRAVDDIRLILPSPYGASGNWQFSLDVTPSYPSSYLYKNQWYYLWYTRTDANNRGGTAFRPGPRQASYFAGRENNVVFDWYPNSATWDGKQLLNQPTLNPGETWRVVSGVASAVDGDGSICRLVVQADIGTQAGTATTARPTSLPTSVQIGSDGAGNVYHSACYMNFGLFGDLSTAAMLAI